MFRRPHFPRPPFFPMFIMMALGLAAAITCGLIARRQPPAGSPPRGGQIQARAAFAAQDIAAPQFDRAAVPELGISLIALENPSQEPPDLAAAKQSKQLFFQGGQLSSIL
ncbi:MAG: hypothetical protein OEZ02_10880 [Anaerolineae bacterium]|nr:hypothetical protein [Anaerolineae bacterium]